MHCEDPLDDLLRFLDEIQTSGSLFMDENSVAPSQDWGALECSGPFLSLNAACTIQAIRDESQVTLYGPIPSVGHTSATLPCSLILPEPIPSRQHFRSEPYSVMHSESGLLSLDLENQRLMEYIHGADFYKCNLPEPKLGSPEADAILFYLDIFHSATFPSGRIKTGRSLYTLLTDSAQYKCMMCGSTKKSAQRAVDCVRAHIGHRPFWCGGWKSGCSICRPGQEPARFFSSRLLREHTESAEGRVACSAW
ncbi:hypothetical protein CPB86DRAFT_226409 [Serendipita vermifera]|nr:hypothetical protein CPB86DRAFT_226409 [Serendipita vermifera]